MGEETQKSDVNQEIAAFAAEVKARSPHPVLNTPTREQMEKLLKLKGAEAVRDLLREWVQAAQNMIDYPLKYGYEPQNWKDADRLLESAKVLFMGGGNRAGKTRYCAKKIMEWALQKPNSRWLCMHESNDSSIAVQQKNIYEMVPPEFRNLKRSRIVAMHYTQKNGFADNTLVLPNGAQIFFRNFTQKIEIIQGDEFDGAWLDECFPLSWLNEVSFRLLTRKGQLLLSVTPILGYTPALAEVLDGLTIDEWRDAELLSENVNVPGGEKGKMPYIGSGSKGTRAIFFHSDMNKFSPWDEMKRELEGRTKEDIMIRAYGWVQQLSVGNFPKFGSHNIADPDDIPKEGTNYMILDPAGARNWYMLWARVCPDGLVWVYREWPDFKTMGEWALPDKVKLDGKRGPAQTNGAGRGVLAYRRLIEKLERGEEVFKRGIDPRAGKAASAALKARAESLINTLKSPLKNDLGEVLEPGLLFTPAPGSHIEEGLTAINNLLDFNADEPWSFYNQPRLRISKECRNLTWCMSNWQNADPADHSASKDPVDALRYLALMQPVYVDRKKSFSTRGGSY